MQITLKLYAMLSQHLPSGSEKNIAHLSLENKLSVEQLIKDLKLPEKLVHLVLLNGIYLEPQERGTTLLKNGDVLAIWPPVAGG